jgi:hypothetical protein
VEEKKVVCVVGRLVATKGQTGELAAVEYSWLAVAFAERVALGFRGLCFAAAGCCFLLWGWIFWLLLSRGILSVRTLILESCWRFLVKAAF